MSKPLRRYLFAEFENLTGLQFDHLEKVCERLFIFISTEIEVVPIGLVQRLQRLGPAVKWVTIAQPTGVSLAHPLTFLLGRLHEKLPLDIEFAILSDDPQLDSLVRFMNEKGRAALRVRRERPEKDLEISVENEDATEPEPPFQPIVFERKEVFE